MSNIVIEGCEIMNKISLKNKIKNEYLGRGYATICGLLIIILTLSIIFFITLKGLKTFTKNGYSVVSFLTSTNWDAENNNFGVLIYIVGSTLVSIGAVIISTPLGVALAVFMNMISPKIGKLVMQPALELFVGIPSVVYGFVGLTVLVPFIKHFFGGYGFSLLAAIFVLSLMILPTITSLSADAIKTIPREYIEASYGLGATRWQTIKKVVVPSSLSGISTGIVMGLARAFGEALAVQMVIGNAVNLPKSIVSATSTLTGAITMDMTNTTDGSAWNNALWSMALLLLIISFLFIVVIRLIGRKGEVR